MGNSTFANAPSLAVRLLQGLAWLFLAASVAALFTLAVLFRAPPPMIASVILPLLVGFVLLLVVAELVTLLHDIASSHRAMAAALQRRAGIASESDFSDPSRIPEPDRKAEGI